MPKTIVCTVGVSASKGLGTPDQFANWIAAHSSITEAAAALFGRFRHLAPEGDSLRLSLSAEIHSLIRIGIGASDRVILVCSESVDGETCAGALKLYLEQYFPGVLCEISRVLGLQVHDAARFQREGIVNFVRICLKAISDYGAANVLLNPTGGFKALVPYIVVVGMLKRVPCKYIFEQSKQLLTLPPLPVAVDRNPFERYRRLFEEMERDVALPIASWNECVRHEDHALLEPLVEQHGNEVTISAVGLLLLDEIRTPTSLIPFLSRQAWTDCLDNLSKLSQCEPFRFIKRVAADPQAFKQSEHINKGNGLRWMKPGRTTDRYLVSIDEWRLLVWRAIREDQEGPNYPNQVIVQPLNDKNRFGPFTRLEFADD